MTVTINFEQGESVLDWLPLTDSIAAGHLLPPGQIQDVLMHRGDELLLNRTAWIDGLGIAVKVGSIYPKNGAKGIPTIDGGVMVMDDADGSLAGILNFHLVTKWKTAGDSLLAARRLARKDSRNILIVGAGTVARSLVDAYGAGFPGARFTVWNRTVAGAERFAAAHPGVAVATDLEMAVKAADIITVATMATEPLIKGAWLQPGQHLDLIGAYTPGMRESDDAAVMRSRLFCDNRATVLDHIGEFKTPIASGAITRDDVIADYYQPDLFHRQTDAEITLFKNGGGAHLDLMVSRHILAAWTAKHG
jgi:ornithine cyclodeaminase/alanine dehydrogenase-like protein (mu-crystallin family)